MAPNIKVYFWGRPDPYSAYNPVTNEYKWLRAGFSIIGGREDQLSEDVTQNGKFVIHLPTALVNSKWSSMTSDNVTATNGLKQWSSIPIVIINQSDTILEEFNISLGAHLWGNGSSEGGFDDFWNDFKHLEKYNDGTNYYDDENQTIKKSPTSNKPTGYGNPMSVSGVNFNDGARLNGTYDATGSFFQTSTSAIWDLNTVGFCPLQNTISISGQYGIDPSGWNQTENTFGPSCYGYINTSFDPSGNLSDYFGEPNSLVDLHWGENADYYSGSNTANGSPSGGLFVISDCRFERFTRFSNSINSGTFNRHSHAIGDVRGMGYLWKTHATSTEDNAFGRQTIDRQSINKNRRLFPSEIYDLYQDISLFGQKVPEVSGGYPIIRGYLVYTLYGTGFNLGTSPALQDTREGSVFGKHFLNIIVNGRYY